MKSVLKCIYLINLLKGDRNKGSFKEFLLQVWDTLSHSSYPSNDVTVRDHDSFGDACGTASVHDHGDISGNGLPPLHPHWREEKRRERKIEIKRENRNRMMISEIPFPSTDHHNEVEQSRRRLEKSLTFLWFCSQFLH